MTWTGRETRALREAMRLSVEAFAELIDAAPRTVSYWESKGHATRPRPFNQSILDTVYGKLDDSTRSRFSALLRPGRLRGHGASTGVPEAVAAPDRPMVGSSSEVRGSTIEQVHLAAEMFGSWNHRAGSYSTADAANAQMTWARSWTALPCPPKLLREFNASLAHLGLVAGFINFDAHAQDAASTMLEFALQRAQEAGDPHLLVKILSHQARQAIYCDRSETALRTLDRALQQPDLTATEQAMLFTGRARAFAKLGRVTEAWNDIRDADAAFEWSNLLFDRPWMQYYDEAQHLGDTGHALFDLAVEDRFVSEALDRLEGAVAGHSGAYTRSKAMSRLKVASLLFAVGDPARAVTMAHQGLPELSAVGSGRVSGLLRELKRFSLHYSADGSVVGLRSEIETLLP